MPEDRITKFLHLIGGASDDELAEIVHQALNAMDDGEAAVAACVDWAATHALLVELRDVRRLHGLRDRGLWQPGGAESGMINLCGAGRQVQPRANKAALRLQKWAVVSW